MATRDIPVGEIVGVEEPICNILAPEKLGENKLRKNRIISTFAENLTNHCLHCHVYTKAPIPCEVLQPFICSTMLTNSSKINPEMLRCCVLFEGLPDEGNAGLPQVHQGQPSVLQV